MNVQLDDSDVIRLIDLAVQKWRAECGRSSDYDSEDFITPAILRRILTHFVGDLKRASPAYVRQRVIDKLIEAEKQGDLENAVIDVDGNTYRVHTFTRRNHAS